MLEHATLVQHRVGRGGHRDPQIIQTVTVILACELIAFNGVIAPTSGVIGTFIMNCQQFAEMVGDSSSSEYTIAQSTLTDADVEDRETITGQNVDNVLLACGHREQPFCSSVQVCTTKAHAAAGVHRGMAMAAVLVQHVPVRGELALQVDAGDIFQLDEIVEDDGHGA